MLRVIQLRSWIRESSRNKVTPERKTIYLAAPPDMDPEVHYMSKWIIPKKKSAPMIVGRPKIQEVLSYLQAFYYGLPVKLLPESVFRFTTVESNEEGYELGLETNSPAGIIGIQTRATHNADFTHQLNLNDLLDAAIAALPEDAYALLMLVEHDIYEDDEDDFACGRAYGGSRIAVVSTARYNPALDRQAGIEREHGWPASHCKTYLQTCYEKTGKGNGGQKKKKTQKTTSAVESSESSSDPTPLQSAVAAHNALPDLEPSSSAAALQGLWLGRVCRTAGHELGHCFGMDHCVYYACSMQGTASIIEDSRQPPYLCPVDLAKMLHATATSAEERYHALLTFCDKRKTTHLFAAYAAWIRARLREIDWGSVDGGKEVKVID
jgi:archaemetzincin